MVEVAAETKRVVHVGIQRRSSKFLQEAVDYIRTGALGRIISYKYRAPFKLG